jgi:hypothetical protein
MASLILNLLMLLKCIYNNKNNNNNNVNVIRLLFNDEIILIYSK